ncbi:unnamed protein product [Rotaria sordida]|uniref:Uncharacterized protein n=1 Tax=Rotaria sordida TaxID=392033 RepID=A0A815J515_9BILA|nr:unnamed protein product [Rotaria sordida]CAF1374659.1 unnamed protein product [Rotaria sordida]CAF1384696.1 unnamed protein product [Rotaria sordida]CAF1446924.1 unnamed protein product [Rotaria sordida]CAF1561936.1 unnamed protein product [Rotaria sordida]
MAYTQQQQQTRTSPEIDFHKYNGRNADGVIEELKKLGYNPVEFDAHMLIRGQALPEIPDRKTLHIYVNRSDNTVQQIMNKY